MARYLRVKHSVAHISSPRYPPNSDLELVELIGGKARINLSLHDSWVEVELLESSGKE